MYPKRSLLLLVGLLSASLLFAQSDAGDTSPAESSAFSAITSLMAKTRQGDGQPSDEDIATRREAGREMATKAGQFLKDYPNSKDAEDAQALLSIGLLEAAVSGDATAADELQTRATKAIHDPAFSESLKLHTFVINYVAHWVLKNGRRSFNEESPEFLKANTEALFAAADVLSDKDAIFKMLLLQTKSGRGMSPDEARSVAQRVLDHPAASRLVKTEAENILAGRKSYAVGKPLDIRFTAVDGRKIDLRDLKGKVVMIEFWATWCGPCVAELPRVKKLYDQYHEKGFEIIGVSLDDDKDTLLKFMKKNEMTWPQYFDGKHWNNDLSFRFGIDSVPTEWLVDKKGILRETDDRSDLEQVVRGLMEEKN